MQLKDLIKWLERQNPNTVIYYGFGDPMSYRGNYAELAFDPVRNARLGDMLEYARSAMNKAFHGYKGGVYVMREWTECHIARYGECSDDDAIDEAMLRFWKKFDIDNGVENNND